MPSSSAKQGNFRSSPNFSVGATRAPVQLLPPWGAIPSNPFEIVDLVAVDGQSGPNWVWRTFSCVSFSFLCASLP